MHAIMEQYVCRVAAMDTHNSTLLTNQEIIRWVTLEIHTVVNLKEVCSFRISFPRTCA